MKKNSLAVIGTSISMENFTNKFIPKNKEVFEMKFFQYQQSIISLMSSQVEIPGELSYLSDFDRNYIESDFEKSFIFKMKNNNPEYLIIDFFADVHFGVIEFNDGTKITNNYWRIDKTKFKDEIKSKGNIINFITNEAEYFEMWKKSIDKLFSILKEDFQGTKIVINKSKYQEIYYDSEEKIYKNIKQSGKVRSIDTQKYNDFWEKMNDYVVSNYEVEVLDLTNEYYLDKNNPLGLFYLHFEKRYYEDFIKKMCEIISNDKKENITEYLWRIFEEKILITELNENYKDKIIEIKGELDYLFKLINFKFLSLIERKEGVGTSREISRRIKIPLEINNKEFKVKIDLNNIKEILLSSHIWDLFLIDDTEDTIYKIGLERMSEYKNGQLAEWNEVDSKVRTYKTLNKTLALEVVKCNNYIKLLNSSIGENNNVYLEFDNMPWYKEKKIFRLKARVNTNISSYGDTIDIDFTNNNVEIRNEHLNQLNIKENQIFDAFVILFPNTKNELEIKIKYTHINNPNVHFSELILGQLFEGENNRLALKIIVKKEFKLINSSFKNDKLQLDVIGDHINDLKFEKILLNQFNTQVTCDKGIEVDKYEIHRIDNESITIIIDKHYLDKFRSKDISKEYLIEIKVKYHKQQVNLYLRNEKNNFFVNEELLQIDETENRLTILKFNSVKKNNKIKVGVLGSCFSRSGFTSDKYFNPGYKSRYEVVLTYFHSSIVSIMNENKKYEEYYFSKISDDGKKNIKNDFEGNFFSKLIESKPHYLIIDLYGDGQRGVIKFKDGSVVTSNYNFSKCEFMKKLPEEAIFYDINKFNEYMEIWDVAAKAFAKEIVKYVPEERIVINYIKCIDKYKDKEGNIKEYTASEEFIKSNNALMGWMSAHLNTLLPKARAIDLRETVFIGDDNYPFGGSTINHYESEYYKEFMKRFDEIVIDDLLSRNII